MIQEFICPNGRMSVNGVCPIFEGDDGQIKDIKKTSTDDDKDVFEFDFEKPTESAFQSAGNIISNNLNAYDNFVQDKLGIPSNVGNVFRIGSALATSSIVPFVIPFVAGGVLQAADNRRVQNITDKDTQGDITTFNMANRGSPDPYGGGPTGIQSGLSSPAAKTSQGVTSAQHAAFRM
tara:strand:- start:191 stop:724 length:534 start_codon:yes stop_codon:yes gene_type:complete